METYKYMMGAIYLKIACMSVEKYALVYMKVIEKI